MPKVECENFQYDNTSQHLSIKGVVFDYFHNNLLDPLSVFVCSFPDEKGSVPRDDLSYSNLSITKRLNQFADNNSYSVSAVIDKDSWLVFSNGISGGYVTAFYVGKLIK